MRRANSFARTIAPPQSVFLAVLLCSVALIGCDNSCFIFVSNPGGGGVTIAGSLNSCPLNQAKGRVRPRIATSFTEPAGNTPTRIAHIYVTIRGIEANPSATAGDDSPDWQELAPNLVNQPAQVDLLAPTSDSPALNSLEYAAVPADAYRQIRLRLSPNQTDAADTTEQDSLCGGAGLNCVVTSDGDLRPVILDSGSSQIRVSSEHITGGFVRVLPETAVNLEIGFDSRSSVFIFTDEAVRFVPVFSIDSQSADESSATTNP